MEDWGRLRLNFSCHILVIGSEVGGNYTRAGIHPGRVSASAVCGGAGVGDIFLAPLLKCRSLPEGCRPPCPSLSRHLTLVSGTELFVGCTPTVTGSEHLWDAVEQVIHITVMPSVGQDGRKLNGS